MSRKYFMHAATSKGHKSFIESNMQGIGNIYVVKGKSKFLKSYIIKKAARFIEAKGKEIECVVSPFNSCYYDAAFIRDIKTAFIDEELLGNKLHASVIDTDKFLSGHSLQRYKKTLAELHSNAQENMAGYYAAYTAAKAIHDEWEKIYINNIDFERLDKYENGLLESLIQNKSNVLGTYNYERFFGCSTPDGSVNYVDNLTKDLKMRYFIKGRPGTGKSTFLKKLLRKADELGYNAEIYYCSFDPDSLDMVLIPELSFCVFDSTAPHELFPTKDSDTVLDFYKEAGLFGVDEKYEREFDRIKKMYAFKINEGVSKLRLACGYELEREYYFESFARMELADKAVDKIVRKII